MAAMSVVTLLGGLLVSGAAAQSADSKQVTVKKGALTITMPAVVNVRAKACVAVPYEYKIDAPARAQSLSVFVRDKNGSALAGQTIVFAGQVVTGLDAVDAGNDEALAGSGTLRFCGQPQRSTLKYGGPWVAATSGKQNAQVTAGSGGVPDLELLVPFQLNVIKRK